MILKAKRTTTKGKEQIKERRKLEKVQLFLILYE